MDAIKIDLTAPVSISTKLRVKKIIETESELLLTLEGQGCYDIFANNKLYFRRYIYGEKGWVDTIETEVTVLEEDENHIIHTTIPATEYLTIKSHTKVETEDGDIHFFNLNTKSYIYPQDIADNSTTYKVYLCDNFYNEIGECENINIKNFYTLSGTVKEDCIDLIEEIDTCGKDYRTLKRYSYSFLPTSEDIRTLILTNLSNDIDFDNIRFIKPSFNPFYYYTIETNEETGKDEKVCHFWGDTWWDELSTEVTPGVEYINTNPVSSGLYAMEPYWETNFGLSIDGDNNGLGVEDEMNSSFINEIKESLTPDFVDMEKIKYIPATFDNENNCNCLTGITLDFHFRQRQYNFEPETNTRATRGNIYDDGWYINTDEEPTTWWNGWTETGFTSQAMTDFITDKGGKSDLLGFLNFTDNDIFYRKKKVGETFVRLSFYTSNDPTTQKLLHYSTIFLNDTELYGKYVKQLINLEDDPKLEEKIWLPDNNGDTAYIEKINAIKNLIKENAKIAFLQEGNRLDSEITITNEYNKDSSSEGFNLYLFAEDAFINNGKTIYLKIEFNHAGNGKTIPMIMWPKKGQNYTSLTTENFVSTLYIPVKLAYINGRYLYSIEGAEITDGNARLILFEPKLDNTDN